MAEKTKPQHSMSLGDLFKKAFKDIADIQVTLPDSLTPKEATVTGERIIIPLLITPAYTNLISAFAKLGGVISAQLVRTGDENIVTTIETTCAIPNYGNVAILLNGSNKDFALCVHPENPGRSGKKFHMKESEMDVDNILMRITYTLGMAL
ncbi:MAG: hypothetical protein HGA67_00025 [Candidatus Yonathbacteria bacterium]|nr:hypothetical protein [Candidatus Yonathbacteria bacterium]